MVTDGILDWFFGLMDWLITGVPTSEIPVTLSLGWISEMNYFLPIADMFAVFGALFLLGGPFAATSLIIWLVVGVLRGGSPKS